MNKRKLLVTGTTFPRWENDTEPRFVLDLCKNMTDLFDVTVLVPASPGAKSEEDIEGVHIKRYHYFPIHSLETLCYPGAIVSRIKDKKIRIFLVPFLFFSLWKNIFKIRKEIDVVHAHWIIPQGIVQMNFNIPYVLTGHGGDVMSMNKGIMLKLKASALRKASYVTGVSEMVRAKEREIAGDIEPVVVPMGVDTSLFGKKNRIENFFGQGNKKVILFVGRLVEIKGVDYLIEAMRNIDNALLYVVGDGVLREELEKHAQEAQIDCFFAGSKTHNELKTIYASADIFVAPSITASDGAKEGLGLVMLEAMASGLPVVASSSGGITQVISNGKNGLLCDEKDSTAIAECINCILEDRSLYDSLVEGSLETAVNFDYKAQAEKYAKLLLCAFDKKERSI